MLRGKSKSFLLISCFVAGAINCRASAYLALVTYDKLFIVNTNNYFQDQAAISSIMGLVGASPPSLTSGSS